MSIVNKRLLGVNALAGLAIRLLLLAFALLYAIPLLIIVTHSLMSGAEIARHFGSVYDVFDYDRLGQVSYVRYQLIPERITLSQWRTLLFATPVYLNHLLNSLRLSLPIVGLQVVVGATAAYGFTVWQWRFKEWLFGLYMIVMVLPFQATLVPNFIMVERLGLLGTHAGIILPWGFNPFAVFIMRQSMREIPHSVLEASQLDGASHWQRFCHVVMPLSKGGVSALVLLTFADSWGMVEQPMVFLREQALAPLSVVLHHMGQGEVGLIFAASVFYMLPMVWLFLYGQAYFEQGIKLSALK